MTEQNSLPSGWLMVSLGELGEWAGGGTPSKADPSFWRDGSIPWVSPKDMKSHVISDSLDRITKDAVECSATKLIREGSVLFVTRSGILARTLPIARTAVVVTVNQDIKALTPSTGVHPDYVAWGGRAFEHVILERCSKDGTTVASLDTKLLLRFPFPLAPEREQRRIVEAIESHFTRLDDTVATLQRVQRNLKHYRSSVLKAAVDGRLVPTDAEMARADGRGYEPVSTILQRTHPNHKVRRDVPKTVDDIPPVVSEEIPEGWACVAVSELLRRGIFIDVKDGNHGTNHPKKTEFSESGLPFITAAHVGDFTIDYAGAPKVSGAVLGRLRVGFANTGDVILTHKGTVGRVAVVDRPCVLTPQTTYYRLNDKYVDARFLALHHASPFFARQLAEAKSQTTRDFVPIEKQYRLFVLLPPPMEQRRIVAAAEKQLALIAIVMQQIAVELARIRRLRQSVLKWAFEGRLVDQDPTDEPASVLLERIKAEREASAGNTERRTRTRKGNPTNA